MNYQNLDQNLTRSFDYVKKDVLKLKESQKKTEEEIENRYEKKAEKIDEQIDSLSKSLKKEYSKNEDLENANKEISNLNKEIKELKASMLSKKDLNVKVLSLYSEIKRGENTRKEVKDLQKKVDNITLLSYGLKKSADSLEKSKLNINDLKNMFALQKEFDTVIEALKEKIKHAQALESHLEANLQRTNEKLIGIQKHTQTLVLKIEHARENEGLKKQVELLNLNIIKLNKEKAASAEINDVKKELFKNTEKVKEKIAEIQKETKEFLPIKDYVISMKDIKHEFESVIIEINKLAENKISGDELKKLTKAQENAHEKTNERLFELRNETKSFLKITDHTKEITELKRKNEILNSEFAKLSQSSVKQDELESIKKDVNRVNKKIIEKIASLEKESKDFLPKEIHNMSMKNINKERDEIKEDINRIAASKSVSAKKVSLKNKKPAKKGRQPEILKKTIDKITKYFKESPKRKKPEKKPAKTVKTTKVTKTVTETVNRKKKR